MWPVRLLLAVLLLAGTEAYFFESGFSHHYTYWAENSLFGQRNVTTVLKFQIQHLNDTENGHRLHSLTVDSIVQFVKDGQVANNPLNWNLTKAFLFVVDEKGTVTLVHCHPEDHEELVFIKKAMVSLFSVTVMIEEGSDEWKYNVREKDHLGELQHDYHVRRTSDGLRLTRNHQSSADALRFHEKTLHFDHRGTLQKAEAKDRIVLKDRSLKTSKSSPLPGELPHNVHMSGEFPEIETSATVHMTLDGKRPFSSPSRVLHNLTAQTLETKLKPTKHSLEAVRTNISKSFDCIRRYPEKDDVNRSLCINDLRKLLQSLEPHDLKTFGDSILGNSCHGNDTVCEDRRLVVIDVIARIGDVTSQELLLSHVVNMPNPVDEELRRVFIHCVAMERPTEKFVDAIATFCFGDQGQHAGSRSMNRTQSRSCLAVGSLVKQLSKTGRHRLANRLATKLETWLDEHKKGDHVISKRSTWLEDTADEDHHLSKAVLLHALGNAALARSRRHLLEHAQPNRGHHMWRRAALDAMRHYTCEETARVMLNCLTNDEKHSVRQMALSVYFTHPKRHVVARPIENDILSGNYTYPAVIRVKRDIFEKVLFKFKLELPKVDWKKEIGSKAVGSSFGLYFENYVDGRFKVLSGYVDVNIHDKLWAEIHVGVIGKQWDILRIEACYRGRLSYNMNIIKDFTVGMFEDITSAFDHIANRIIEPVVDAANKLATEYQDPASNQPKSGFEPLASAVKQLPMTTEGALSVSIDLAQAAETLGSLPLVSKIQQLARRAQSLMEDMHSEATDFFTNVKDTAVVALPFAEKEIRKSLNTVLEKLGLASKAPNQVFAFVERAKMGFQLAMKRILEGNIHLKQAMSFLTGSRSTFLNAGHEIQDVIGTLRQLLGKTTADHSRRKREASSFSFEEYGQNVTNEIDNALSWLSTKVDELEEHFLNVSQGAEELQEGFDKQALYVQVLKNSFQSFKEAIDMVKSRIHALFGLKFHPGFPNQRRDCDDKCGCGYFPTDCTRYGHPGVDLKWNPGWNIPSPVAGMMYPAGENSVRIEPKTSGFEDFQLILSNIDLKEPVNETGEFVDAGQVIGTSGGHNGCEDPHFHLAMKRSPSDVGNGLCYYVDPSPYLDRMQPIPQWQQECKEFTFKHIGNVVDFYKLTDGFTEFLQELKKIVLEAAKGFLVKVVDELPDTGFVGFIKQHAVDIIQNLDFNDPSNLKNLFQNATTNVKNFFNKISTGQFNLTDVTKFANRVADISGNAKLKESVARVTNFVKDADNFIEKPSLSKLGTIATGSLERLLASQGLSLGLPPELSAFIKGVSAASVNGTSVASLLGGASSALASDNKENFFSLLGRVAKLGFEEKYGNGTDLLSSLASLGGQSSPGKADPLAILSTIGNLGLDLASKNLSAPGVGLESFLSGARDLLSAVGEGESGLSTVLGVVTPFLAGKDGMMTAIRTSLGKVCPSFRSALAASSQSVCVAHEDCLGLDCDVTVKNNFVRGTVNVSLRVLPEEREVQIKANGVDNSITDNGQQVVAARLTVLTIFEVKFKVSASWSNATLTLSLSLLACTKFGDLCLPEIPVVKSITFDEQNRRRKRSITDLLGPLFKGAGSLPVDDLQKLFTDLNLPIKDLVSQISGLQDGMSSELEVSEDNTRDDLAPEFQNPKELEDSGAYPLPGQSGDLNIPFFKFTYAHPVGPVLLRVDFYAGGALGVSFEVNVKAIDSLLKAQIKPFVVGELKASLSVSIIIVSGGITLKGYVMRTSFPLTLAANYTKQPIVATKSLGVELIPLELKLEAWVKVGVWVFSVTFRKVIWQWRADPITGTIWKEEYRKDDLGPPRFPYCDRVNEQCVANGTRRKRQAVSGKPFCHVKQVAGRHPKDTAFRMQFTADDEDSDVQLWYTAGDYPGGTNIIGWTEIRGGSLTVPAALPCGIPLYFTIRARNSQGLETTATCSTHIDCTFPDGRVDSAHRCSSHPSELAASVIMYEDSPLQPERLYHGVGYSPSSYGHEVVDWQPLTVSNSQLQPGVTGSLKQFSAPRPGRLTSQPKQTLKTDSVEECASSCLKLSKCIVFTHNQYVPICELQEVTEGPNAERMAEEHYLTYERLGISLTADLRYRDMPLRHGTRYYVNADVENVLGYHATLTSFGTMVDFTPPEPGAVGEAALDTLEAGGCNVSILQRCVNAQASSMNHRKIIDGKGASTVFNGNRKGQELTYTIENYHASANWEGFKDEECGIHGYTFAVGTSVCGTDVAGFTDPHAAIPNPNDWTYTGLVSDIHLEDGEYYVTVQAVSDIIHGGDLVTTVCHSTPFLVDTEPPDLHLVESPLFDETFKYLVIYFNATDATSGIASADFGLGKTKYDVAVRRYMPYEIRGAERTYLVFEEFSVTSGFSAWVRLKVTDKVGLFVTGASDNPILIDHTPPIPGRVLDGLQLGQDICCQNESTQICAHWTDFDDPESGISGYMWGVGLTPGKDDVVEFHSLNKFTKHACQHVNLTHNVTYFSTVIATNGALIQKSSNASSSGVLVDTTPPVAGIVSDGEDVENDQNFTSQAATLSAAWAGFHDPETGLKPYSLSVFVNGVLHREFVDVAGEQFTDHSFSFQHRDTVHSEVTATNRAGGSVTVPSNGLLVDHTPPQLIRLSTVSQKQYQTRDDLLQFVLEFQDPESGVSEYRCAVYEIYKGARNKFWPQQEGFHVIPVNETLLVQNLHLDELSLQNGGTYSLKVTAINRAHLSLAGESDGVTVDTTPPIILEVSLARPGEEEELNDNDEVELVDGEPIWVSWKPRDEQSGIQETRLCIGDAASSDCLTSSTDVLSLSGDLPFSTSFHDLNLTVSTEVLYRVYLIVVNGAGLLSTTTASKPFLLLKANVPGTVVDGRTEEDVDFSRDRNSVAMTFSGFSSEACGVVGYEWAVGTQPFSTDVMPFTRIGLVVDRQGRGVAQAHMELFEGQTYYSTVRAQTGPNCHEEYIVSSSDGFTVDTTPPTVTFFANTKGTVSTDSLEAASRVVASNEVVYQSNGAYLSVGWEVQDNSGINNTELLTNIFNEEPHFVSVQPQNARLPAASGQQSLSTTPLPLSPKPALGDSMYSTLIMIDMAGNTAETLLPVVTFDYTIPSFQHLTCTSMVSSSNSILRCTWYTIQEAESPLSIIQFGIGTGPAFPSVLNFTSVPLHNRQWSFDLQDVMDLSKQTEAYVIAKTLNGAGLQNDITSTVVKFVVDVTPPELTSVFIVTSPEPGFHDVQQRCQTAQDYVEILLKGLHDAKSEIKSVEIALGSAEGRTDIRPFHQCQPVNGLYVLGRLGLRKGSTVFATVRVTNSAGLYTLKSSGGVTISSEPRLVVWDGPGESDVDGQAHMHAIQGQWLYTDNCPVLSVEWSVRELTGDVVTDFKLVNGRSKSLYNDDVDLENFKTYVNYVRITDALNRTVTAFSDGVTVMLARPVPGTVRDGLGSSDIDFQEARDRLSANWDPFGDALSTLPSDHIVRYEAAIGTDRRQAATRADVHAFEDVGLATEVTFQGLNLTAKTVRYYVTVRAYSGVGSYIESSSDGIRVGFSSEVTPGQVLTDRFQSSVSDIRFSWTEFESDMEITHYYAGVSTSPPPWDNSTLACMDLPLNRTVSAFMFDIRPLQSFEDQFMAVFTNLTLVHGGSYFVTVVAADDFGHCSLSISGEILVDTTPPLIGNITVDGTLNGPVIFLQSSQFICVNRGEFLDPESEIEEAEVELFVSDKCLAQPDLKGMPPVSKIAAKNESRVFMRGLELQEGFVYYLTLSVTNGAGLTATAVSRPLILDTSPPSPGAIKLGTDWKKESRVFQNKTDQVNLVLALASASVAQNCKTEIDLFSPESRMLWQHPRPGQKQSLQGVFAEDCAGFDSSGLHVIVRHNAHLTGVDRGATQFAQTMLREGDFVFRLSPAAGMKILSGVALASPSLAPPFLVQNGQASGNESSMPCEASNITCLSESGNTASERSTLPESEFGVGLSFLEHRGEMRLLFWAQDAHQLQQTWLPLDFDPSSTTAEYVLRFEKKGNNRESWDVTVSVNNQIEGSASGLIFPGELAISVYTWNIDDFVPKVTDPFNPFRVTTLVTAMSVPVVERPLCSYGAPFYDTVSGIKEIWVGVSDGLNSTANIAPYQLAQSFCLPCPEGCESLCPVCNETLPQTSYDVFEFTRSELLLTAANNVSLQNGSINSDTRVSYIGKSEFDGFNWTYADMNEDTELPAYYVDVKVVDHSGSWINAKSNSFIIDTSPPTISSIQCFDPLYSLDEPVFFIGNNYTVAVRWLVSEDVTDIASVEISVGTAPELADVSPKVFVDSSVNLYIFSNLTCTENCSTSYPQRDASHLAEDQTYYITVEAKNEAGLSVTGWANFTVHTAPPDMSTASLNITNVTTTTVSGREVGLLENTVNLEMNLDVDNNYIEYYEWAIGTEEGKDDLFPRTVVGPQDTKKVAIVEGYFKSDLAPNGTNIGDFTRKNFSSNTPPNPNGNKFVMEPGRCLYQTLYGASKAHVLSSVRLIPVCIRRPQDILVTPEALAEVIPVGETNSSSALKVKLKLSKGGLMAGPLSRSDLAAQYGSSASTEFAPYIVPPDPEDPTSRYLRKRLLEIPGPAMYLAPVANSEFEGDVQINYTVPGDLRVPPDGKVTLLVWNPDIGEWMTPEEACGIPADQSVSMNERKRVYVKVCAKLFSRTTSPNAEPTPPNRRKRSQPVTVSQSFGPRMMTVGIINATVTNEAPVVLETWFSMLEDQGTYDFHIRYTDAEGDEVQFTIERQASYGRAEITAEGHLLYTPEANFGGIDIVHVKGKEVIDLQTQALGIVPNEISFTITANVTAVNDAPTLVYFPAENTSVISQTRLQGPVSGNGMNMSVLIEGNTTTHILLGAVVFGERDRTDSLEYMDHVREQPGCEFELKPLDPNDQLLQNAPVSGLSNVGGKEVFLNLTKDFAGHVTYQARAKDAEDVYSMQLTLGVYVLQNPCVHGHCIPRATFHSCRETRRAFTFDPYKCHCDPGYEGEWCEVETNECIMATCSPITDCVDLVADYRCDYNPVKLAAIIVCSVTGFLIFVFVIYRVKKRSKGKKRKTKYPEFPKTPSDEKASSASERPKTPPADYQYTNNAFEFDLGDGTSRHRRPSFSDVRNIFRTGRCATPPADYQYTNAAFENDEGTTVTGHSSTPPAHMGDAFENPLYGAFGNKGSAPSSDADFHSADPRISVLPVKGDWRENPMYKVLHAASLPQSQTVTVDISNIDPDPNTLTPVEYRRDSVKRRERPRPVVVSSDEALPSAEAEQENLQRRQGRKRQRPKPMMLRSDEELPPADYDDEVPPFGVARRLDTRRVPGAENYFEPLGAARQFINPAFDDVPLD